MVTQLSISDIFGNIDIVSNKGSYIVSSFSAGGFCDDTYRQILEKKYATILEISDKFDRQSVSYQLSKKDALHSWLRYKEGFSANLVNMLLDYMKIKKGEIIMDPFMGSGTTALVCNMRGINSIGYDIMPISKVAITAKSNVMKYNILEIQSLINDFCSLVMPTDFVHKTPHINITNFAYPEHNEKFIQYATEWIDRTSYSDEVKNLFVLCMLNSLERCSYTTKSGQYLSWDSRSKKVIDTNIDRNKKGKKNLPVQFCREVIEDVQSAVTEELQHVLSDIKLIQKKQNTEKGAIIDFKQESVLFELPKLGDETIDGVITSPPYCNRYDYTRTYALELVYLGIDEKKIKDIRQALMSCTVESKNKQDLLKKYYYDIGASERYEYICDKIKSNKVLQEVIQALLLRKNNGDINNNGIIRMVEGYFTELAFVYAELYRVCKKGAIVAFVNDNVRYGGEVIPVDFLSTSLAESFGFTPIKIFCLKQQKGNSSQQMKKYGRVPLRKSITIWKKD